jgi:uncharacterized membrane protein YgdD (TMEM256/DUF423 family)
MPSKIWIALGALAASLAVAAGAIGSHVLKGHLEPDQLETYEIAVRYQMYHAFGLILVGLLVTRAPNRLITIAGLTFLLGIALFSGGIYVWLATAAKPAIAVVPIGGTAWIIGWLLVAAAALTAKSA